MTDQHSAAVSKVIWRHKKRGTTYQVVTHFAALQCASDQATEDRFKDLNWTIYRSREDGATYVRLTSEFMDGRFERIGSDDENHLPALPQRAGMRDTMIRGMQAAFDEVAEYLEQQNAGGFAAHIRRRSVSLSRPHPQSDNSGE